jgi:hypothetical protein
MVLWSSINRDVSCMSIPALKHVSPVGLERALVGGLLRLPAVSPISDSREQEPTVTESAMTAVHQTSAEK